MNNEEPQSSAELYKNLCLFIKHKYFSPFKIDGEEVSLHKYAAACNMSPSTVARINKAEGYNVPWSTIFKLCKFEKIPVGTFIQEFENTYRIK